MMPKALSYSSTQLYTLCPQKYKYSYIDRLRERGRSSPLAFGTALDEALSACLLHPDKDEKEVFDNFWEHQEINKRKVCLVDSVLMTYYASDFDESLLTKEDLDFINAKAWELFPDAPNTSSWQDIFALCVESKKENKHGGMREDELTFFNICCWLSLRRKGHMMLEAHRKEVFPKFKKVVAVQKTIALNNGEDVLTGKIDLIAELSDGVPIVFDYKTSSRPYTADSAATSPQLAMYAHAENISMVGYIVFGKKLIKNKTKTCFKCGYTTTTGKHKLCDNTVNKVRCNGEWIETTKNEIVIQIIIDKMTPEVEHKVLEDLETVNLLIKQGVFEKNVDSCWAFGQRCAYYLKCFKDSDEGLETV